MSFKILNIWEHFIEEYNENSKYNVHKYLLSINYIPGSAKDITWSPLHRVSQSSGKMRELPEKKSTRQYGESLCPCPQPMYCKRK